MNDLKRNCPNPENNPKCRKDLVYSNKYKKIRAEKNKSVCCSCAKIGSSPWNKGKTDVYSIETTNQMSESQKKRFEDKTNHPMYGKYGKDNPNYGQRRSEETKKLISEKAKGREPWNKGKTGVYSEDVLKKMGEGKKDKKRPEVTGENNGMYNRCNYDVWLEKYGKKEADKRQKESNNKISKNRKNKGTGKNNGMYKTSTYQIWVDKYGKDDANKKLKETKRKQRLSAIKRIEKQNGQISPNYNKSAISKIETEAKKYGITDLQHAETLSGEYYIKELGYFVDGRSKEKNIVIEYMEDYHRRPKQKEKDEKRKQEIIEHLGCKFIEIKEWEKKNG